MHINGILPNEYTFLTYIQSSNALSFVSNFANFFLSFCKAINEIVINSLSYKNMSRRLPKSSLCLNRVVKKWAQTCHVF